MLSPVGIGGSRRMRVEVEFPPARTRGKANFAVGLSSSFVSARSGAACFSTLVQCTLLTRSPVKLPLFQNQGN